MRRTNNKIPGFRNPQNNSRKYPRDSPPENQPLNILSFCKFIPGLQCLACIFTLAALSFASGLQADAVGRSTAKLPASLPASTVSVATNVGNSVPQKTLPSLPSEFVPLQILNESLWQRLSDSFEFSEIENNRIDKQLMFLQSGLKSLRSNLIDASPYLFYICLLYTSPSPRDS